MNMNRLLRYGIPPEIISIWTKTESENLLPVQSMAVGQYGLFEKDNLLIQAPTSSGKTFVGEMAAIQTALRRKKVIYLVPLKALAEEKYTYFKNKYQDYGLNVIISTRDHREFDGQLEDGDFSIAVVVYEKLAQLLVRRPERIAELELVIADELEILSDIERGSCVEILLTRLIQSSCRVIGLSAVIGYAEKLAEWMNARLLRYERRPVELRFGVLHDGIFSYRTHNDLIEAEEPIGGRCVDDDGTEQALLSAVESLSGQDESCLVFVKTKQEARFGAKRLAEAISDAADDYSLKQLKKLECTVARDLLLETLQHGVAFHSADLTPEERRIVEDGFRKRRFKVLVSTSTLAVGLNMPSCNVFITPEKWCYEKQFGMPWKTPILRSEYENMGGRAGRLGSGLPFGRSILIAQTDYDRETLWRRYVEGEREGIRPRLSTDLLENEILSLVASRECTTEQELETFFDGTLSGQWIWREEYTLEEVGQRVRNALNRAIDAGMIALNQSLDTFQATPMGLAVASKGISMRTAKAIEDWVSTSQYRDWQDIDALLALALTEDGRTYGVSLYAREYDQGRYVAEIREHETNYSHLNDVPLSRICNDTGNIYFEDVRAIKVSLILEAWIEQRATREIEDEYHTMAGQILVASKQLSWLLDATVAISQALGVADAFISKLETLVFRVKHGVGVDAVPLAKVVGSGVTRSAVTALLEQGFHTPQALVEASAGVLESWMSRSEAKLIREMAFRVTQRSNPAAPKPTPRESVVLSIDETRPGEFRLNGKRITLQDKQYRLISLLAENAGRCVGYEQIYAALWQDTIVEQNQIHFQKRKLKKAINLTVPDYGDLIKTVPKRGFVLQLEPSEVEILRADRSEGQLVLNVGEVSEKLVSALS